MPVDRDPSQVRCSLPNGKLCLHRNDRLTEGSGTAILVRRGIAHLAVPVPGLMQLEATAIQVTLASKPVKILAAYLTPPVP